MLDSDWQARAEDFQFWLIDESGDVKLDSDCLPKAEDAGVVSVQCFMFWGRITSQCIKIGNVCIKIRGCMYKDRH